MYLVVVNGLTISEFNLVCSYIYYKMNSSVDNSPKNKFIISCIFFIGGTMVRIMMKGWFRIVESKFLYDDLLV